MTAAMVIVVVATAHDVVRIIALPISITLLLH